MSAFLLLTAGIVVAAGAYEFWTAFQIVEPTIPPQFKEKQLIGKAFDVYVWNASIPRSARRKYLRSAALGAAGLALIAIALMFTKYTVEAGAFAVLSVLASVLTCTRWIKHRGQF